MVIELDNNNRYKKSVDGVLYPSTVSWSNAIPLDTTIRLEFKNGAFIDLVNEGGTLKAYHSKELSGEEPESSVFTTEEISTESFRTFKVFKDKV